MSRIINNKKTDPNMECPDYITKESQYKFANDISVFIQSLVNSEIREFDEEFISESALQQHYGWHCLCGRGNLRSRPSNVYYDFNNIDKYRLYENEISQNVLSTRNVVYSLLDTENINKFFRKLFEGNQSILFALPCNFQNSTGHVMVGLNSFSTDKTTNYNGGNTLNLIIFSGNGKTITLYPLDVHKVENKFNSIVSNYSDSDLQISINND